MIARPYAAAKRTLGLSDKLLEINWGLLLLVTLCACAGFAMLYSVAGARFQPWALKQMGHFTLGLIVLLAAAMIDIRVWMSLAYPAYGLALLLLWFESSKHRAFNFGRRDTPDRANVVLPSPQQC